MTELDLTRLREVAAGVFEYHSSPWYRRDAAAGWSEIRSTGEIVDPILERETWHDTYVLQIDTTTTAEHIATFDPPTVLALLDRIEALEAVSTVEGARESKRHWKGVAKAERRRRKAAEALNKQGS